MSVGRRYVLDANVFIEAHQRYYGFDICPGFWLSLLRQHQARRICSIDKIKQELVMPKPKLNDEDPGEEDKLSEWVQRQAPRAFFQKTTSKTISDAFSEMVKWAQDEHQFTPGAKAEFASVADGWLVAHARVNGLTVVTHETYAPEVKNKVKIPNVCIEFDVEYCNTFEMLRALQEAFVLEAL